MADNSVDSAALSADCVVGSKIADSQIATEHIVDQAVTLAKLPHGDANNDGKFLRANNGADPSFETVSIPAGTTINNNADNRVITGGSGTTLNGESNVIINSDGDLLIGRTSTIDTSEIFGIKGPSGDHCTFGLTTDGTTNQGIIAFNDNDANFRGSLRYRHSDDHMKFYTAGSERFLITNTTFRSVGHASNMAAKGISLEESSVGGRLYVGRNNNDTVAEFYRSGSRVGSINVTVYGTGFNQTSDYRLKENVVAISDAITRIKTLKPSRFNFKVDKDTTVDGFLAHEVTPVVPEAITGTKDEVDSDNKPVYQGIDHSKLVPLLTAALQEAIAKIETLETKVAALEAT